MRSLLPLSLKLLSLSLCAATLSAQAPQPATTKAPSDPTDIHDDVSPDIDAPEPTFSLFSAMPSALPSVLASNPISSAPSSTPQQSLESVVPNRLVVFYRGGIVPANATALATRAGAHALSHMQTLGLSTLQLEADSNPDAAIASLLSQPEVTAVLHDRYVKANKLLVNPPQAASPQNATAAATSETPLPQSPHLPASIAKPILIPETDSFYETPQGWATVLSGGYGNGLSGSPATGPWTINMGAGVRIAILDSGVDATHPDIAPNLVLNISEVQQAALPSACDDGSPTDQTGHGTFTASLAAAAQGFGTGLIVGVAPQAYILNIKVVERLPGPGSTLTAQCEAGSAAGLLSWVLQGIQDAISNHANILSASLGTLVDTSTGDGAGWVAQMNAVTYAAAQAGVLIVAAAGNDGLDLTNTHYADLPAQARNVLPVVASTNPACAEDLSIGAACTAGLVTRAYYSNHGTSLNAIAAPGGSLPAGNAYGITGFVRGACSNGLPNTTDGLPATPGKSLGCFGFGHLPYVEAIGTSASAPLVAGAAAVLKAAHPTWTPTQIISALLATATRSGNMTEPSLNLPAALALQPTP